MFDGNSCNHTTKFFIENLLAIEMRKTQILITKPVYLGLWILDLSKTVMYEFLHDWNEPKKIYYLEKFFIIYIYINYIITQQIHEQKKN